MNTASFLGSLIGGAMLAGGKRHRRASHFLRGSGSSFLNTSTLLTLAGLAWAGVEALQTTQGSTPTSDPNAPDRPDPSDRRDPSVSAPPPLPVVPTIVPPVVPPIVPPIVPTEQGLARIAALAISAARADGETGDAEHAAILAIAREHGLEACVASELQRTRPLAEIVAGITDPAMKHDLYVLAFTIVRADENVRGAERVYLAQLAYRLDLDAATAARLESETCARIDRARVD